MTPSELTEKPADAEKERPRLHQWWSKALFDVPLEESDDLRATFLQKLVEEDLVPPMVLVDGYVASTKPKESWNAQGLCTASRLSFQSFLRSGVESFAETFFERPPEARKASWGRFKKEAANFPEEDARLDDLQRWLSLDYAEVENAPVEVRPWLEELSKLAVASRGKRAEVRRTFRPPTPGPSRSLSAKIQSFRKAYPHWCAIDPIYMQRLEGGVGYPLNQPSVLGSVNRFFTRLSKAKICYEDRWVVLSVVAFCIIVGTIGGLVSPEPNKFAVTKTPTYRPIMQLPDNFPPPEWWEENLGKGLKLEIHSTLKEEGKPDEVLPVRTCFIGTKEAGYVALTTKEVVTGSELGRLRESFGAYWTILRDPLTLEYQVTKRTMKEGEELEEIVLECELGTVIYRQASR